MITTMRIYEQLQSLAAGRVVQRAAVDCSSLRAWLAQSNINTLNTRRLRQDDMAPVRAGKFDRHGVSTKLQEVATQGMVSRSTGNWPGYCQTAGDERRARTNQTDRVAPGGGGGCGKHKPPWLFQYASQFPMSGRLAL